MNLGFVWAETLSFGMCLNVGLHLLCSFPFRPWLILKNIASRLKSIKTLNVVNTFKIKFNVPLNIEKTEVIPCNLSACDDGLHAALG